MLRCRIGGVASLALAALALACVPSAAAAAPAWELTSEHTPTAIPLTPAVNQVDLLTVSGGTATPNEGTFELEYEGLWTKPLHYPASAKEVQTALEAVASIGTGNVTVSGGPKNPGGKGQTEWSYLITFVGALAGRELEELGVEEGEASPAEEKAAEKAGEEPNEGIAETSVTTWGERDTVLYRLAAANVGDAPSAGKITLTDRLPKGLATAATPEGGGWACTPTGEGRTTITCTTEAVVPAGAKAAPITLEAYVETATVKEGEQLLNKVEISGGGAATVEAGDPATVSSAPAVLTEEPSAVTASGATLNAAVDPNGREVSECRFQYGTTAAYGSSIPCTKAPGSGTSFVAVAAALSGLAANTEYHYRILARNSAGTSEGSDRTLTTGPRPAVATGAAGALTRSTATLNATVDPQGSEVSECRFEYGTTAAYGSSAPCASSPGAGTSAVAVTAALSALAADTEYHYRILARNSAGTSPGADRTLKTLPAPPTAATAPATSLTPTTATLNGAVNPNGAQVSSCQFEYGTSAAYGSIAPCTPSPGAGSSPVAVSAAIAGLTAGTTYHFRVSATGAGGPGAGADETLTTPSAPAPSQQTPAGVPSVGTAPASLGVASARASAVGTIGTAKGKVTFTIGCQGPAGTVCTLQANLTTTERTRAGRLIGVAAAGASRQVSVGTARASTTAGRQATFAISLNATGRKLLARFPRLPVHLTVVLLGGPASSTVLTRTLTIKRPGK